MTGRRLPAPQGTRIDRARPLCFRFDGREVEGFAGDTVASALLAAGVQVVGRSYKLRRPRGVVSCGVEEPCAIADVGEGAAREANARLTQVLARDNLVLHGETGSALAGMIDRCADYLPAGFYYKTFMWPNWKVFEPTIREIAATARAPDGPDPARYDEVSAARDVLVIGAGLAGMQAAVAAVQAGRDVLLLESDIEPGGWALAQASDPASERLRGLRAQLRATGVRVLTRTTAVGVYDHGLVLAVESLEGSASPARERLWKIRAARIVLATGAFERPLLFPDNDRPGVMLAGAVERYAGLYGVACGARAVLATACDAGYDVARALGAAGIALAAIVDRRPAADCGRVEAPAGVPVLAGAALVGIAGKNAVRAAHIASDSGGLHTIEADLVATVAGFTPNLSLYAQAGGNLRWLPECAMFVPDRALPGFHVVGACAGAFELETALAHAQELGARMDGAVLASPAAAGAGRVPADTRPSAAALAALKGRPGKQFVDLHNDVTTDDVELAARENYRSVEHLKRYTTLGMAPDQGKTSNVNGLVVLGAATQRQPQQVGTTKFRPPFQPVTLNAIVGGRSGARYRPLRLLPARAFHAARGALFEEFGGWERPAAYPQQGESLLAAAEREAAQVRAGVGLFDGSPLGKIEVIGPDAADFLDLMYVGTMSTLAVGHARYGVLLNENGVIGDDGIVARLGPEHFWVNATSSGVERTALAFEEWLQCEFVHHRVAVVPVTAQWGNITVSGPRAWQLLERLGFDASLAPASMKHMTMRVAAWEGEPARVLRASFNGELGYEINLPMSRGPALLEALWTAGQGLGVGMYGVEALMTMRTEKGFIHVGADTDGTTLPQDVGLARAVERKAANFVGRRSLTRPAGTDPERLQLVGLQPVDRRSRLPAGAHLARSAPPCAADGFITSSCFSPALGQPVALGMLRGGSRRLGERLQAWHLATMVEVEVVKTPFYDPAGERLHG